MEAARRELFEESGALEFDIEALCDYWAGNPKTESGDYGMAFVAKIQKLGNLPESEMAEVKTFDILPENLTYEAITPVLFAKIGHYYFKRAGLSDLDLLVSSRIDVLRAANRLSGDVDMSRIEKESRRYYRDALANQMHTAYLVYDSDQVIGAGGISFYQVMPTYHNPTGKKAYVMNMYTHPDYRRRGIAYTTLDLLVREAKYRGVLSITLESTDAGKPLYEKYGFVKLQDEMELAE